MLPVLLIAVAGLAATLSDGQTQPAISGTGRPGPSKPRRGVRPRIGAMDLPESQAMLDGGLVAVDMLQLKQLGISPIQRIADGKWRYRRRDPHEDWLNIREIEANGGGDCEDLACAVCAEYRLQGRNAKVAFKPAGNHTVHAVVLLDGHQVIDPSMAAGMGVPSIDTEELGHAL